MNEKICPKCDFPRMKGWQELSAEEKILAEKLPFSASLTQKQREQNLFCPRCWFEKVPNFQEFC